MCFGIEKTGVFAEHFNRQLKSSLGSVAKEDLVKFSFGLPGNSRYPYINKDYLDDEILQTLNKFFPLGVKLIYVLPTSNDDHCIEVCALVKV